MCDYIIVILLIVPNQICGNHVLEILLLQWENPFSAEFNMECCDENVFYPNCSFVCNTRFEVCLQPFSFPPSTRDCTFGSYEIPYEPSFADPNNITFIPGVNVGGNIPNPIQYGILQPVSVSFLSQCNFIGIKMHFYFYSHTERSQNGGFCIRF